MSALEDMTALVSELKSGREGGYTTVEIAEEINKTKPNLVSDFLQENSFTILTRFVSERLRLERGKRGSRLRASNPDYTIYENSFVCDADLTRKNLGEMMKDDHIFVADSYADDSQRARFHEDIHRLIAKKLNGKRTDEVFTEEQLESLFGQLDETE